MSKKITLQPDPKLKGKKYKRKGPITKVETALVTQVVLDQPGGIKPAQVTALARALNRPIDLIKPIVEAARTKFVTNVARYVDIHMTATEGALAEGDHEQALKGSQWAIQNMAHEGVRVVDKITGETNSGPRVVIGIKVGGVDQTNLPQVTVESE